MSAASGDVPGFALQLHWPTDEGAGEPATSPPPPDGTSEDPEEAVPSAEAGPSSVQTSEQEPWGRSGLELPAMLPRVEAPTEEIWAAVARMSMQIDGMTAASNSLRSALTDRLTEYTEALGHLARHQSAVLEDQRRSNVEITNELREISATPQKVHEQVCQLEAVAGEVSALVDVLRANQGDSQRMIAAAERLPRVVGDGLAGFAARVLERISAADRESESLAELRSDIAALRDELTRLHGRLDANADDSANAQAMSEAQLRQILSEVTEHSERTAPMLSSDQMDEIAQTVVKRLQQSFMLVDDDRA